MYKCKYEYAISVFTFLNLPINNMFYLNNYIYLNHLQLFHLQYIISSHIWGDRPYNRIFLPRTK